MRIATIVVTYNRASVLSKTLAAVARQTRAPNLVVVANNASTDDTIRVVQSASALHVALPENLGYAAGLAAGIQTVMRRCSDKFDAFWLLDDDSEPSTGALERLERALERTPDLGLLGLRGGTLNWTGVHHLRTTTSLARRPLIGPGVRGVDFVLVDGAMVTRKAVEVAGVPRGDFFMMLEDVEYGWRVRRYGFRVATLEEELIKRGHLGSTGDPARSHWRSYYQSRNHVRWALETKSPQLVAGCAVRQGKLLIASAVSRTGSHRARAHARGVRDGVLGRMGRTVEPGAF